MNKKRSQPKFTWDFYSGISGPLLTILGCLLLMIIKYHDSTLSNCFPVLILFFTSCLALSFWLGLLAYINHRISRPMIICIGRWSQSLIIVSQVLLIIGTILRINSVEFAEFGLDHTMDNLYWILTAWAWLETTHHAVYKLLFGKKNALLEMDFLTFKDIKQPIGGAIGVMIRKMDTGNN